MGVFWQGWDPACFICLFSYLIQALNSPRAAQGQEQAGSGPGRPGGRLWIRAVGCSPPMGALHPITAPTFQQDAGAQGVSPEEVWDIWLCTCLGKTQRWVIPHPGRPETDQGENHEVPSLPPAPRAGIWGIHRFWGYGHLGLM